MNINIEVPLHIGVPTPLLVDQVEILHYSRILEANLGAQGANELLNGIYKIVQQLNSKAVEERFLHLEEILPHAQHRSNTVLEAMFRKTIPSV